MVTSATRRRAATTAAAVLAVAVLTGGTAWADEPSPAPTVQPTTGTWIIGGTLLEGQQEQPATQPAAQPAAQPVTRTTTRTHRRSTQPASVGGPAVLPFTGPGHVELLLPLGLLLVATGAGLTVAGRPRAVPA